MIDGYVWLFGFLGLIALTTVVVVIVKVRASYSAWKAEQEAKRVIVLRPQLPPPAPPETGEELGGDPQTVPVSIPPPTPVLGSAIAGSGPPLCPCGARATTPAPRVARSEGLTDFVRRAMGAPHRFRVEPADAVDAPPATCAAHAPLLAELAREQILQIELKRATAISQAEAALARWETEGWRARLASFTTTTTQGPP